MTTYIFRKNLLVILAVVAMAVVLLSSPLAHACPPMPFPDPNGPCDECCDPCCDKEYGGNGGEGNSNTMLYATGRKLEATVDYAVPGGTMRYAPKRRYDSLVNTAALGQGSEGNRWGSYQVNTRLWVDNTRIFVIMGPVMTQKFECSASSVKSSSSGDSEANDSREQMSRGSGVAYPMETAVNPACHFELYRCGNDPGVPGSGVMYRAYHKPTKRWLTFHPISSLPVSGKVQYRDDAYGNRISFGYDGSGRMGAVTTPESHQVVYKRVASAPDRLRSAEVATAGGEIVSGAVYVYHGATTDDCGTSGDLSMVHRLTSIRHSGTTTSAGTATQLNDTSLAGKGAAIGDWVVIVDGSNMGHVRTVSSVGSNSVEWTTPLPYSMANVVSYFLVKNTGKIETIHYRYYKSSDADGTASQLKAVYEHDVVQELISAAGWASAGDLLSKADNTVVDGQSLSSYASKTITYYKSNLSTSNITTGGGWGQNGTPWGGTSETNLESLYGGTSCNETGFVRSETIRESCGSCGGGSAHGITYYFYYMNKNGGANASETYRITIEDTMYGGQRIQRKVMALNKDGYLLREAIIDDPATPRYWCKSHILDSNTASQSYGKPLQTRMPSAHTGVNTAALLRSFLNPTAGTNDADTVHASAGLVYAYTYNGDGHRTATMVKNGADSGATAYYVFAAVYGSDAVADESSDLPKITYTYPTPETVMTNGQATTYSYTFHDTEKQMIKQTTVTGPAIAETENGDNAGIESMTYRDDKGRLRWTRDGEGRVSYYSYHAPTGGLAYAAMDVKTDANAGGLPTEIVNGSSGKWDAWGNTAAPMGFQQTGDALQLVSKTEYDTLGRAVKSTDPMGTITYSAYRDAAHEVRVYPAWDTAASKPRLPVQVTQKDAGGRTVLRYAFDASGITFSSVPDGSETAPVSLYTSRTTWNYDSHGHLVSMDRYVDASPANKLTTHYGYDIKGRQNIVTAPDGTVTETRYDNLSRPVETWTGSGSQLAKISSTEYDNNGVGDGHVTAVKSWLDDTAAYAATTLRYDYRGRRDRTLGPDNVLTVAEYDWAGLPTAVTQYASVADINATPSAAIAKSTTDYDATGRAFRQMQFKVANGAVSADKLTTHFWYDKNDRLIKTRDPNGLFQKTQYDGIGRPVASYLCYQDNEPVAVAGTYAAATNVTGDVVIEQTKTVYDNASNVILTHHFRRKDSTPLGNTGELVLTSGPSDPTATVQVVANWYEDFTQRLRKTANYGDNGNAVMASRPSPEPTAGGAGAMVTTYQYTYFVYDANNQAWPLVKAAGNDGKTTWSIRDLLGRSHKTIENYDDGAVANNDLDKDRTTLYGYDAKGRMTTITAKNATGTVVEDQITTYIYDPQAFLASPENYRQDMVHAVIYPDSAATYNPSAAAGSRLSGTDAVFFTYDRQGRRTTAKDQRGVEHTYTFTNADQLQADTVTAWDNNPTDPADQTVQAITYTYDSLGRPTKITSHSVATDDPNNLNVVNQNTLAYDGYGNLKQEQQAVDGAVVWYDTPFISHTYSSDTAGATHSRKTNTRYPSNDDQHIPAGLNPAVTYVDYTYGAAGSISDRLGRPEAISGIANYTYNGVGQLVEKSYATPNVRLTPTYDRFGRIVAQTWQDYSSPSAPVAIQDIHHGYSAASNRTYADNKVYKFSSQHYTYDGLDRLKTFKAGILARDANNHPTGINTGAVRREQDWTLSQLGNATKLKDNNDANWVQSSFNLANEIISRQTKGGGKAAVLYNPSILGNSYQPRSAGDTYTYTSSSGVITFTGLAADGQCIVLYGEAVGPMYTSASVSMPAHAAVGDYIGYVFGYKSADDYWMAVREVTAVAPTHKYRTKIYHVVNGNKGTALAQGIEIAWTPDTANGMVPYLQHPRVVAPDSNLGGPTYTFANGAPTGKQGFVTNIAPNGSACAVVSGHRLYDSTVPVEMLGRWLNVAGSEYITLCNGDPALRSTWSADASTTTLKTVRLKKFQVDFTYTKTDPGAYPTKSVAFCFDVKNLHDYKSLTVYHSTTTPTAPVGRVTEDGAPARTVAATAANAAAVPLAGPGTPIWYRVTCDGAQLTVQASLTEAGLSAAPVAYQGSFENKLTGGHFGFRSGQIEYVDNITVRSDPDNNGSFSKVEIVEQFNLDAVQLRYDAAGNLTFDGNYAYTYDAWNRQIMVKRAYITKDPTTGNKTYAEGSAISTSLYDGQGRRVKKAITNCGDLDATHVYYYDGQRMIEERNGSGQLLKTYVWGQQYIDELLAIHVPTSLTGSASNPGAKQTFWAMHDANYNVIGIVNESGRQVERYEYTPYGQRTIYGRQTILSDNDEATKWSNDATLTYPQLTPAKITGIAGAPFALNDFGHQGLMHDTATGLIYNRRRMYSPSLMRMIQEDPEGYIDGMNYHQYVRSNPIRYVDPEGLDSCVLPWGRKGAIKITDSKYWQFQEITDGKYTSKTRVVKNCHVVIAIDHTDRFLNNKNSGGPLAAGNSFWYTRRGPYNAKMSYQTMSAMGTLSCNADSLDAEIQHNYSLQPLVPKNYRPGDGYEMTWQERPGVIKGFPRIQTLLGPDDRWTNAGYGIGKAGFERLLNDAWDKGATQANTMASDCRCECDEITLVFVCATTGAIDKMRRDGFGGWCEKTEKFPCKKGAKSAK